MYFMRFYLKKDDAFYHTHNGDIAGTLLISPYCIMFDPDFSSNHGKLSVFFLVKKEYYE